LISSAPGQPDEPLIHLREDHREHEHQPPGRSGRGSSRDLLALTACGAGRTDGGATGATGAAAGSGILVGTTDKVTAIDPAGSYDNGSFNIEVQVYPFLMSFKPGGAELAPDAAKSCEFTSDTV
jgi:ABC-type transport system substrate-binding protein